MTEGTKFVSNRTAGLLLVLVVAVTGLLMYGMTRQVEHEQSRDCMSKLVQPTPGTEDYNDQALAYGSEVRKCMRG